MARPLGSTSHWWTTRKRLIVLLYDPTDNDVELIRGLVRDMNQKARDRRGQ